MPKLFLISSLFLLGVFILSPNLYDRNFMGLDWGRGGAYGPDPSCECRDKDPDCECGGGHE